MKETSKHVEHLQSAFYLLPFGGRLLLFRPEAVENHRTSWTGGLRAAYSFPQWVGVSFSVFLAVAIFAYCFLGSYASKARISGILVPRGGELPVAAPVSGRINGIRIREGQSVKAGEVLLVLDTDKTIEFGNRVREATAIIGDQIENRRRALSSQRQALQHNARIQQQAIRSRSRGMEQEINKLEDEVNLQSQRKSLAITTLHQYTELGVRGYVSSTQVRHYQEALIDQEARLRSLERGLLSARKDHQASVMELRKVDSQLASDLTTIERENAALNQEDTENSFGRFVAVTASRAGTVSALAVRTGQNITAGQSLAAIQPSSTPLEAHLYAPSRTMGFVSKDQQVLVRYAAFPYQKFGVHYGQVSGISGSAFAQNELPSSLQTLFARQPAPETLYRITIALRQQEMVAFDRTHALRPGMLLEADIVLDRRSIFEWLFEPLYAFANRS